MNEKYRGYFFLFLTIVLFSTYEVVSKTLIGLVSPLQINLFRFYLGGIILFFVLLVRKDIKISPRFLLLASLTGAINVVISMNLVLLSIWLEGGRASVTAALVSTNPLFVMFFASLFDNEKLVMKNFAGILFCFLGVSLIFNDTLTFSGSIISALIALGASFSFAVYTILGKKLTLHIGSIKMNCYSFLGGGTLLLLIMLISGQQVLEFNTAALPQLIYLGTMVTGVAYIAYFKGLTIIGAGKGSLLYFLKPIIAALFAVIFLKESLTTAFILGTALILTGLYIALFYRRLKNLTSNRPQT